MGKASAYLIKGGNISAQLAFELGLVNEILPEKDFLNHCITKTKEISLLNPVYIKRTKDLMLGFRDAFRKYSDNEGKYIEKY